jgi:hypothetical protein
MTRLSSPRRRKTTPPSAPGISEEERAALLCAPETLGLRVALGLTPMPELYDRTKPAKSRKA